MTHQEIRNILSKEQREWTQKVEAKSIVLLHERDYIFIVLVVKERHKEMQKNTPRENKDWLENNKGVKDSEFETDWSKKPFGYCPGSSGLIWSMAVRRRAHAGWSVQPAGCPSWTSCILARVKSSESLRILALQKWSNEKSIMGSNTEARSSVRSSGCTVRTKRTRSEKLGHLRILHVPSEVWLAY